MLESNSYHDGNGVWVSAPFSFTFPEWEKLK